MAFRVFGGMNYAPKNNIVSSKYNSSKTLLVSDHVGQSNSHISFLSDISSNTLIENNTGDTIDGNLTVKGDLFIDGSANIGVNLNVGLNLNVANDIACSALNCDEITANHMTFNTLDGANIFATNGTFSSSLTTNSLLTNTLTTDSISSSGSITSGATISADKLVAVNTVLCADISCNNMVECLDVLAKTSVSALSFSGTNGYITNLESSTISSESFNSTSDYRLKRCIVNLGKEFTVDRLQPVEYDYVFSGQHNYGFIAHELQEEYPCLVNGQRDGDTYQTINYQGLIAIMVKEIQDLKKDIAELKQDKMKRD